MLDGLSPWLPGFAAAYAIQAVAVASPGPSVALLLGLGLSQGRASALAASLGIAVGAAGLALATTQGLGLLMLQVAWLAAVIRVAGACYLLWLAIKAWRRALSPPTIEIGSRTHAGGLVRSFGTGLTLQLTNPKAIIFWLAIAAVGATQNAPAGIVTLFVAGAFTLSLAGHVIYAVLLSSRPFRFAYDRARRWIEAGVGTCLAWFAFRLATERI
ncbi:MAG: LysE family translocator [Alphaproteobacteria bacterium]|nr:LysE family translocator [Alphaproteobacteria bacterium]